MFQAQTVQMITMNVSGTDCTDNNNECLSNPCLNGGDCVDQRNGYLCRCPSAWTGLRCQIEKDECISNPCKNGAQCKYVVFYSSVHMHAYISEC